MIFMKQQSHLTFISIVLCNFLQVSAQPSRTDTVAFISSPDTSSWQYKMQTSEEKWSYSAKRNDFQPFYKFDYSSALKKNSHTANISYYGNATLFWLNDIKEIELAVVGITQQNANEFIYHATVNDSFEIIHWMHPSDFRTNKNITYAYLGKFNTKNKIVKFELYNIKNYSDRMSFIFNDLFMPPAKVKYAIINYNDKYLFKPFMQHYIPDKKQHYFKENEWQKRKVGFNWSDSINHIAIEMENSIQNDMYNVYLERKIEGKTDTVYVSNNWEMSHYSRNPSLRINSSFFNKPGNYQVIVTPEAPDDFKRNAFEQAVIVPFNVLPSKTKLFTFWQLLFYIFLPLLAGGILFSYYYLKQKRRLFKETQEKQIIAIQLNSVRSQLNPHFMFNALSGIQNFINKNDNSAANLYLSKFARITRNVLNDNNKDLISILDEVNLLEDYLQMEQMRFGFKYNIYVDDTIDKTNTEIPAMLTQPFVENAVKHGISGLKHEGVIDITFRKEADNLILEIKDNGKGFNIDANFEGVGMKLSENRINLLNQLHKESLISLQKKSSINGTLISIVLNNWT